MPFFNFRRSPTTASNAGAAQPESMEAVRKLAKHRLIGSALLVLAGVVGFPLLFDTQPRPIAVDIPIEIPGKNTVKPLTIQTKPNAVAVAPASASSVAAALSLASKEEIVTDKTVISAPVFPKITSVAPVIPGLVAPKKEATPEATKEPKPEPKSQPKPDSKPEAKPETKPDLKPESKPKPEQKADQKVEQKPATKPDDGARAKALLDGQAAVAPAAAEERLVVQVGAFADADKAKEVRQKLERAGLKTYTQVADTKDGKRIRVRVGPFASKAEADKAASKIKTLDLPAAILTL